MYIYNAKLCYMMTASSQLQSILVYLYMLPHMASHMIVHLLHEWFLSIG